MTDGDPRFTVTARLVGWALAAYWTLMFVSTHVPVDPVAGPPEGTDKLAHLGAYALLAALLATYCTLRRGAIGPATYAALLGVVAIYGAVDELLQPFVSRVADPWDWIADLTGGALGLAGFALARAIMRRNQ